MGLCYWLHFAANVLLRPQTLFVLLALQFFLVGFSSRMHLWFPLGRIHQFCGQTQAVWIYSYHKKIGPEGSVRMNPNGALKAATGGADTPLVVRHGIKGISGLFLDRVSFSLLLQQQRLCSRKVGRSFKTEWRRWDLNPKFPARTAVLKTAVYSSSTTPPFV
jgi:hypothetical protein